jgi:hypothetical protein
MESTVCLHTTAVARIYEYYQMACDKSENNSMPSTWGNRGDALMDLKWEQQKK